MASTAIDSYIIKCYNRWLDYARYHASLARIADQAEDILNTVLTSVLEKPQEKIESLLNKKSGQYTELDFYILRMIKLNAHSKTSPYRHKTKDVPHDDNTSPWDLEIVDQAHDDMDPELGKLQRYQKAREILEELDIKEYEKQIFSWKFFEDNPLTKWPGGESYTATRMIFLKVKHMMVDRIKNPYHQRKPWTGQEIAYLKAEFPHKETMKIAGYLNRNYNSVARMAERLGLQKTPGCRSRINRYNNKKLRPKY